MKCDYICLCSGFELDIQLAFLVLYRLKVKIVNYLSNYNALIRVKLFFAHKERVVQQKNSEIYL